MINVPEYQHHPGKTFNMTHKILISYSFDTLFSFLSFFPSFLTPKAINLSTYTNSMSSREAKYPLSLTKSTRTLPSDTNTFYR